MCSRELRCRLRVLVEAGRREANACRTPLRSTLYGLQYNVLQLISRCLTPVWARASWIGSITAQETQRPSYQTVAGVCRSLASPLLSVCCLSVMGSAVAVVVLTLMLLRPLPWHRPRSSPARPLTRSRVACSRLRALVSAATEVEKLVCNLSAELPGAGAVHPSTCNPHTTRSAPC